MYCSLKNPELCVKIHLFYYITHCFSFFNIELVKMDADTDKDPPLIEKEDDRTNPTAFDNDLGVTQGEEKEEHGVVENK